MQYLLSLLLLAASTLSFGQKIDSLWFSEKWEKADKQNASYYRVIRTDSPSSFFVKDFFISGEIQMEGNYSSLDPQIKNGSFTWWHKNGIKKMEATFRNDTTESFKEYNAEGRVTNQKAYIKVLRYVEGKPTNVTVAIDALPEFRGGRVALSNYISNSVRYPSSAVKEKIAGKVVVQFVVAATGKIEDPKIIQSVNPALDKEALRVIKSMPDWIPGILDGKPIKVAHQLPIQFNL